MGIDEKQIDHVYCPHALLCRNEVVGILQTPHLQKKIPHVLPVWIGRLSLSRAGGQVAHAHNVLNLLIERVPDVHHGKRGILIRLQQRIEVAVELGHAFCREVALHNPCAVHLQIVGEESTFRCADMQLHPAGFAQSIGESGPRHCLILHGIHQNDLVGFVVQGGRKPLELVDILAIETRLHVKQRRQVRVDAASLDGKSIAHYATQHQTACQALHCYMGATGGGNRSRPS
mmetsp:Transcript_20789/g.49295  ORF Transcript_20789/g.49295 Transcript_20789/m.49295 type:complete len:231 (+) Transcript_20789:800-1492(+)